MYIFVNGEMQIKTQGDIAPSTLSDSWHQKQWWHHIWVRVQCTAGVTVKWCSCSGMWCGSFIKLIRYLTCNPAVVLLDIDPRIESSNYNKTSTQILIVVLFLISQHWYRPTCSTGWVVNPCSVGCYSARNRNTLLTHAAVWPNYILLHEHRYTQWRSCDICETGWSMSPFIVERKGIIARI